MNDKIKAIPNVKLGGGKIAKEKGRKSPAGELGNEDFTTNAKNYK